MITDKRIHATAAARGIRISPPQGHLLDQHRRPRSRWTGDHVLIEDLGSTSGTSVNGSPIIGTSSLHDGDLISLASVQLRYQQGARDPGATLVVMPVLSRRDTPSPPVRYDVREQRADSLINVGRDQYNAYTMQRQSFLADVAAAKTKASVLAWLGFVLFIAGAATYAAVIIRFVKNVGPDTNPDDVQLLGPDVLGVPVGAIGFGVAGLGSILLIVGIVRHIIASSRRRRVEREMPLYLPPPRY